MFKKILIANRGEIACRVIRTARRMGIATVAVYSEADAEARHVRLADEAVCIGPAAARESYLRGDRILEAALASGAQAIHPGYGFLSENDGFAEACVAEGVTFIGPPASAIRAMGSKSAAKALMEKAGVPLTPGYHGDNQDPDFLANEAERIGYPVLIKASAGGGGKGMRRVDRPDEFAAALTSCRREASNAFDDDHVLVEKYVLKPRHIEVQVFGDIHGNVVYLFERDCSVQRRHQKVLEEAPAPHMTAERREAMGQAAVNAAKAVGYVGAGTVEFIANQDGSFYFMEMNTRLQVEHPVTELVTGLDLVEWQLRVASGEPLPLQQEQLRLKGHAVEARVYAEDPDRGFLPSTGRLLHLVSPTASEHVRIDSGVDEGDEITPFYDPMIAKLIVWGSDRREALARMEHALAQYQVVGVANNLAFLSRLVASPSFVGADLDTGLIEREQRWLFPAAETPPDEIWLVTVLAELAGEVQSQRGACQIGPNSPWSAQDGFRINGSSSQTRTLRYGALQREILVESRGEQYVLSMDNLRLTAQVARDENGEFRVTLGDRKLRTRVAVSGDVRQVFLGGRAWQFTLVNRLHTSAGDDQDEGGLRAPMPGRVIALLVEDGVVVERGTPLIVLEAMKMEHTVLAPRDGKVKAFHFAPGDQVQDGAELVEFEGAE